MNSIVDRFVEKITEVMVLDDIGVIKIRYAISAVFNEVAKFIVIVILFYMLNMLTPLLFTFFIIVPVRVTTGGLHFNSNICCFAASLIFFVLSVILLPQIALQRVSYQILLLVSVVVIWLLPLAPSVKRPIISKDKYSFNKYLSIIFTVIAVIILLFVLNDQHLIRCGIWAFTLQAIQLLGLNAARFIRRYQDEEKTI